jgi:hypothetical protein
MDGHWTRGNAHVDSSDRRGWLVGHFIDPSSIRHSEGVEVKWALHPRGQTRSEWVTGEVRTTFHLLISGRFRVRLPDEDVTLTEQGDYVMWGPGVDHSYEALEDSVVLVVRWPSAELG